MDNKKEYLLDPEKFGLDEKRAIAVSLLDEDQLRYAAALVQRQENVESAKAACAVLLSGKPELLDQLQDEDYAKAAWYYEQDYDPAQSEAGQMSESCETVLDDRFGKAWLN